MKWLPQNITTFIGVSIWKGIATGVNVNIERCILSVALQFGCECQTRIGMVTLWNAIQVFQKKISKQHSEYSTQQRY